jgi:HSP20 family molecular chaperone IbpA
MKLQKYTQNGPLNAGWNLKDSIFTSFFDWPESIFAGWESSLYKTAQHPVDVYETNEYVVVEVPLAGFKKDDIKVSVNNGSLSIQASIDNKNPDQDKKQVINRIKRNSVSINLNFAELVSEEIPEAKFEDGMLKISLHKKQKQKIEEKSILVPIN